MNTLIVNAPEEGREEFSDTLQSFGITPLFVSAADISPVDAVAALIFLTGTGEEGHGIVQAIEAWGGDDFPMNSEYDAPSVAMATDFAICVLDWTGEQSAEVPESVAYEQSEASYYAVEDGSHLNLYGIDTQLA